MIQIHVAGNATHQIWEERLVTVLEASDVARAGVTGSYKSLNSGIRN